ncbi:MAG: hypothetical protein K0S08_1593 [Gammaproteobacteria bacterium]|jgi:hypothetical protein|nr:hypothetical protein [Gammaproteobacteria bacterium]
MKLYQNLKEEIIFTDSGRLRLKQAIKTVFAIILSALICHWLLSVALIVPPFMAFFLMQIHQGDSRKDSMKTAAIAYPVFIILYVIGAILRHFPVIYQDIGLVFLAFFAFYVQGFGSRYSLFPIFAWVMYFFSMILPPAAPVLIMQNVTGMLITCVLVFFIYFYFFPSSNDKTFFAHLKFYFKSCRGAVNLVLKFYQHKVSCEEFVPLAPRYMHDMRELLVKNYSLYETIRQNCPEKTAFVSESFFDECERARGMSMIIEASKKIALNKIELPLALQQDIISILQFYANSFPTVRIDLHQAKIFSNADVNLLKELLGKYKANLLAADLPVDIITYLWNLYLGLAQLSRMLRKEYMYEIF